MLVLTRKKGESIMINDDIEVVVLQTEGDTVRIGIKAPREVEVYRKEVHTMIRKSNQEASQHQVNLEELQKFLKEDGRK